MVAGWSNISRALQNLVLSTPTEHSKSATRTMKLSLLVGIKPSRQSNRLDALRSQWTILSWCNPVILQAILLMIFKAVLIEKEGAWLPLCCILRSNPNLSSFNISPCTVGTVPETKSLLVILRSMPGAIAFADLLDSIPF